MHIFLYLLGEKRKEKKIRKAVLQINFTHEKKKKKNEELGLFIYKFLNLKLENDAANAKSPISYSLRCTLIT